MIISRDGLTPLTYSYPWTLNWRITGRRPGLEDVLLCTRNQLIYLPYDMPCRYKREAYCISLMMCLWQSLVAQLLRHVQAGYLTSACGRKSERRQLYGLLSPGIGNNPKRRKLDDLLLTGVFVSCSKTATKIYCFTLDNILHGVVVEIDIQKCDFGTTVFWLVRVLPFSTRKSSPISMTLSKTAVSLVS